LFKVIDVATLKKNCSQCLSATVFTLDESIAVK